MSVFARFAPRLQEAIVARLGWTTLRPVQELAGEAILAGKNAVVLAPTAGGKTEASIFPTLSGLVTDPPHSVGALYIAPIKALLNNQSHRLDQYTEMLGLRRFVWHGDTTDGERKKFLKEPAELLMTTPESLEVMLVSERVDADSLFSDLRVVIIDEVHAIAGSDRGAHLMSVLERINTALARLREVPFWNDESIWVNVRAALPNYRLSKFQPLMPDWIERETLSRHLLDAEGTKAFLGNKM